MKTEGRIPQIFNIMAGPVGHFTIKFNSNIFNNLSLLVMLFMAFHAEEVPFSLFPLPDLINLPLKIALVSIGYALSRFYYNDWRYY